VPAAPGPSTLLIAMDGAMVHTTRARDGYRGWQEAKAGVCARFESIPLAAAPKEPDEAKSVYQSVDYGVGFEPQADFLPGVYAHALPAGLKDSSGRQIVPIADGAHWIREPSAACLRVAGKTWVEILDFYHASQHLWTVAQAVWPHEEAVQTTWAETVLHRLRHEGGGILEVACLAAVNGGSGSRDRRTRVRRISS
jgi:hypothetical protein